MKIARFSGPHAPVRLGLVEGNQIVDLFAELPQLPADIAAWLPAGEAYWRIFADLARSAPRRPLSEVRLHAPLHKPGKLLAIGANYQSHLDEIAHLGLKAGPRQIWFNKQTSCLNGPYDDVELPSASDQVDYEGELAVVIGRRCRHATTSDALSFVGGYTVCNDVSVRDVQMQSMTMTLGKSFDTHGPLGPWITSPDEVGDPQALEITTMVNGDVRQRESTAGMIHDIASQIVELSAIMTLEPGDVLATGTPAGVALARRPPSYLQDGDRVRVEISGLGFIENRFTHRPDVR